MAGAGARIRAQPFLPQRHYVVAAPPPHGPISRRTTYHGILWPTNNCCGGYRIKRTVSLSPPLLVKEGNRKPFFILVW